MAIEHERYLEHHLSNVAQSLLLVAGMVALLALLGHLLAGLLGPSWRRSSASCSLRERRASRPG